jgi:hypothetical protein
MAAILACAYVLLREWRGVYGLCGVVCAVHMLFVVCVVCMHCVLCACAACTVVVCLCSLADGAATPGPACVLAVLLFRVEQVQEAANDRDFAVALACARSLAFGWSYPSLAAGLLVDTDSCGAPTTKAIRVMFADIRRISLEAMFLNVREVRCVLGRRQCMVAFPDVLLRSCGA